MRQVIFEGDTFQEKQTYKIRQGRPRPSWTINTMQDAWNELAKVTIPDQKDLPIIDPLEQYEWENERQNEIIALYALVRAEIFSTSASKNWFLKENISKIQQVFQQIDDLDL